MKSSISKLLSVLSAVLIVLAFSIGAFSSTAMAAPDEYDPATIVIPVTKTWNDNSNAKGDRPTSITVNLYRYIGDSYSEANLFQTLTLSGDSTAQTWTGEFVIHDTDSDEHAAFYKGDDGLYHAYNFAIDEVLPSDATQYSEDASLHKDPEVIMEPTLNDWERITPGNQLVHALKTDAYPKSFVDVRQQNNQFIWTPEKLSPLEQELLLEFIKSHPSYEHPKSVTFLSGYGAYINGVTFSETEVVFDAHSRWSMYAVGSYTRSTPEQYEAKLTNDYTELTTAAVQKVWDDNNDQDGIRPTELSVTLLADNEEKTSAVLSAENNWTVTVTGLPKESGGQEISYTWTEALPEDSGYEMISNTTEGSLTTITNQHIPETVDINVEKVWEDTENQDGIRPDAVEVNVLADGALIGQPTLTLNERSQWTGGWTDLPKFNKGNVIVYSVDEIKNDVITGTDGAGTYAIDIAAAESDSYSFTITNTHTPELIDINVKKVWDDGDNKDGIRPGSVTVNLVADGVDAEKPLTLDEAGKWEGSWTELPKYMSGQEISYTVEEVPSEVITGTDGEKTYAVTISGDAEKGFTVTNKHTPKEEKKEDKKDEPKTGDQNNFWIWGSLLIGAGLVAVLLIVGRKRIGHKNR